MKNYKVKALYDFNDTVEKNEYGVDTPRKAGISVWNCTKERYEFLASKKAVMLVGIDEIKEEAVPETIGNEPETEVEEKPVEAKRKQRRRKLT